MLNAIVNGKRRGSGLEGMSQRIACATGSEDLLTALVFERLSYLPDEALPIFWEVLLPESEFALGAIERIEFWPRLELDEQIVEPDVVVQTTNALIVVEAKRWDKMDQQYAQQIAREILAASATKTNADGLPMLMLLVGGRQDTSPQATEAFESQVQGLLLGERLLDDVEIAAVKWTDILRALDATADSHGGCRRIRDDVECGLRFHGLTRQSELRLRDLIPVGIGSQTYPARTSEPLAVPELSGPVNHSAVPDTPELAKLTAVGITSTRFPLSK